jgi:formylglycine-generating enzyme required for sulfatase activity
MQRIDADGYSYCIDVRETLNSEYAALILANPPRPAGVCSQSEALLYPGGPNPTDAAIANDPVLGTSWCHAYRYCQFIGKRLCGAIGGGVVSDPSDFADSEWVYACSNGGTTIYPYGDAHVPDQCNLKELFWTREIAEPGEYADCRGIAPPFDNLVDMVGNVSEWTNNCIQINQDPSLEDPCILKGGNYYTNEANPIDDARCDALGPEHVRISDPNIVGIRCCSDAN